MDKQSLIESVQLNCHISDARHAGNYTLCIYLLKMREFYRWEQGLGFGESLSNEDIGLWLTAREALWQDVEENDYTSLLIAETNYDPFHADSINRHLQPHQLVYSAGYGIKNKPHFVIADLESNKQVDDFNIYICAREYARDLTSPPAMSQGNNIYIRRESFKRMIWEHMDQWRWNKPENAMARAIRCYDFDNDMEASLTKMTSNELDAAVLHEIGEIQAGRSLEGWQEMMTDLTFTKAEIMARAVRDHFADTLHTLPTLIENDNQASIHFYFANLTNMRKYLFPSLMDAYKRWCDNRNIDTIAATVNQALDHWKQLSQNMLVLHQADQATCSARIETLVESNRI